MAVYGYVRVSTADQNPERQIEKMRAEGVGDGGLFVDKASGKDLDRPMYRELVAALRPGDTLLLDSLDRLGRNYGDVTSEWRRLTRDLGCDVRVLDLDFFDSAKFRSMGPVGTCVEDMLLSLLAYVAQAERDKIRARQAEGIAIAKSEGRYRGRAMPEYDPALLADLAAKQAAGEVSAQRAADMLGVSRSSFYKLKAGIA